MSDHHWITKAPVKWPFCSICGIVKRSDGKNSACKGPTKMRSMELTMTPREKGETK